MEWGGGEIHLRTIGQSVGCGVWFPELPQSAHNWGCGGGESSAWLYTQGDQHSWPHGHGFHAMGEAEAGGDQRRWTCLLLRVSGEQYRSGAWLLLYIPGTPQHITPHSIHPLRPPPLPNASFQVHHADVIPHVLQRLPIAFTRKETCVAFANQVQNRTFLDLVIIFGSACVLNHSLFEYLACLSIVLTFESRVVDKLWTYSPIFLNHTSRWKVILRIQYIPIL